MPKPDDADLENRFLYHKPTEKSIPLHATISEECLRLAKIIRDSVPEGRDLSLALTKLEEVRMRANAGIACNLDKL